MVFKIFALLARYLPDLIRLIVAIESEMKGRPGAAKKEAVLAAVQAAAEAAGESSDEYVKAVGATIDRLVKTFNTFGWGK